MKDKKRLIVINKETRHTAYTLLKQEVLVFPCLIVMTYVKTWNRDQEGTCVSKPGMTTMESLNLVESGKLLPGHARRKESGYAYEEDIPFVTTRPRELFSSVTYSEMDMAQSLKRCARIVSLSVTDQTIFLWRGTIEMNIYDILCHKTKSLDRVRKLGDNTNWIEVIAKGGEKYS